RVELRAALAAEAGIAGGDVRGEARVADEGASVRALHGRAHLRRGEQHVHVAPRGGLSPDGAGMAGGVHVAVGPLLAAVGRETARALRVLEDEAAVADAGADARRVVLAARVEAGGERAGVGGAGALRHLASVGARRVPRGTLVDAGEQIVARR